MGRTLTYPKRPSNTVNRYKHRATYDLGAIHSIINTSQVLHVSFNPGPSEPFPAILPMIGQMGSFDYPSASIDEPLDCYLHGYVSSRIMNLARDSEEGLPVCVAASKVDGLILSLTPNSHSYNYRSAILQGYAKLVTDEAEKLYAMELVTNSVLSDRWAHTRVPPDRAEMSSTVILKVRIVSGSGKIRDGGVSDEKKDTGNEEVANSVWTGVVPVWETFGEPIPSPGNKVAEVPGYIKSFVAGKNEENSTHAVKAIGVELPREKQH
ncbi:flavin-nucleotide-binding protein [Aspergillus heteromorphus CBS 117.55]|uniref:Flavin-nucleotide-binding protein n=1 Tax=Aspergillus heteromorphus CBS 117.55 TaxID=1448321 RepID=A0A317VTR3_9EURO|nr:flavin-nucleotide-binding protein [Aspergillus heteromorphus CBS 117.55]PWY76959.1 flavin-nucleotide-binding protein [Aspergillus heteromorphus CBS 117.55]